MKIIVSKAVLGEAANLLQRVINPKNALPILGDVLFDVKDNQATLTASDSEVTLTTTVPLETMEGDGRFCVSANELATALDPLVEQPVTILATTESNQRFTLQHQSGEAFFPLENADEYPLPMAEEYPEELTMDGTRLKEVLRRSLWATAKDDLRPVMNGVNFALREGWLDVVASDGHVLVRSRYEVIDRVKMNRIGSFIMPKKVAALLSQVLQGEQVEARWNDRSCTMRFGNYTLTFRLVEGKYPNYNSIIPEDQPLVAVAPRAFLSLSLKKVIPFTADTQGSKMVRLTFERGQLTLTGQDFDFAMGATDRMAVRYDHPEPITLGLSGTRLAAILSKLDGQETEISMTDPSHAVVLRPEEQPEGQDILMLAMPMLLND